MTPNKPHYAHNRKLDDTAGGLSTLPCRCGHQMQQVIHADVPNANGIRVGWYCPSCRAFTEAIGRERIV